MFVLEKRDAKTLNQIIKKNTFYLELKSYQINGKRIQNQVKSLKSAISLKAQIFKINYSLITQGKFGYKHFTVNHSKNFVDPVTKKHTQLIERMWGIAKKR